MSRRHLHFLLFACLFAPLHLRADWQPVTLPDAWRGQEQKKFVPNREFGWFRTAVVIPEDWRDQPVTLFLEPIDDARQIYLNGQLAASIGSFPPEYRSGLGTAQEHPLPSGAIQFGATNHVAIRVYSEDSRGGFNVAAPALFSGDTAIHLQGPWEARSGDNRAWAQPEPDQPPALPAFHTTTPAAPIKQLLKRLPDDPGPQSPEQALQQFTTAPDLEIDLVLSEPEITQPVFFTFDPRGRIWVVQYRQYPSPAGLTMVSRDVYLRTVYDKVPAPPPHHDRGADRISVHWDSTGDGRPDRHRTFVDGLNIVSSVAVAHNGVYVLNPPYLLFYPDADQDDAPDGDPEVLLEGFGLEDSHSIANSLTWGPDGWLYGAQGSTVSASIRQPGSDDPPVHSIGQLIWRYHPGKRIYEIFAEGGGNAFGLEIDAQGRFFSGHNGGNTRGFHYIQGGYFQKGFGKHGQLSNPYTFGYFPPMQHHDVPRFTHNFIIYDATALPETYHGQLFGIEPLQGRVVLSRLQPAGSTLRTEDRSHPLTSGDPWFRPVDIKLSPDGAIHIADFYEQRIDHASHYQGRVHKQSGRIYRLRAAHAEPVSSPDLTAFPPARLIQTFNHPNRTVRRLALQQLSQTAKPTPALINALEKNFTSRQPSALEALWALHQLGALDHSLAKLGLQHPNAPVRHWTVQLLGDDGTLSQSLQPALLDLAARESAVTVRSQIAASAPRFPTPLTLGILERLLTHSDDQQDPYIPLLLWWAIEAKLDAHRSTILDWAAQPAQWNSPLFRSAIAPKLFQRLAVSSRPQDLDDLGTLFDHVQHEEAAQILAEGLSPVLAQQPDLVTALPPQVRSALATATGSTFLFEVQDGDPKAVRKALAELTEPDTNAGRRIQLLHALTVHPPESARPIFLKLATTATHAGVQRAALQALQQYSDPSIAKTILSHQQNFSPSLREQAQLAVTSRPAWTGILLQAVESGNLSSTDVSPSVVQKLLLYPDPDLRQRAAALWPNNRSLPQEEVLARVQELSATVHEGSGNPYKGKELYQLLCAQCHQLFDEGGQIGPDLTPYQRKDLHALLLNTIAPSWEIREGYEQYLVQTTEGRTMTGFLIQEDSRSIVLRTLDGQTTRLARDQTESLQALESSLMPEGLIDSLPPESVRNLLAYLRSSQPLPSQ